jgi:hypothetical protein
MAGSNKADALHWQLTWSDEQNWKRSAQFFSTDIGHL